MALCVPVRNTSPSANRNIATNRCHSVALIARTAKETIYDVNERIMALRRP